jgi:two-component system osmolarity sensor histidine kinase EnvZ
MSSSPSEEARPAPSVGAPPAFPPGRPAEGGETRPRFEIRPRGWLKNLLPRTMFGRSLLIIVMPLVLVQVIATCVFYGRHWETVSRRLSSDVAGDISFIIARIKYNRSEAVLTHLLEQASASTEFELTLERGARLPKPFARSGTLLEATMRAALSQQVRLPYRIDAVSDPRYILIDIQLRDGVLSIEVPRERLYSSTTYIFILWMLGSSLVLLSVAIVFLRNQVKSVRRLALAADRFGKGQPVPFFKIEGSIEVRQAAVAFMQMQDRIERQIRQRTEMLAGVSHDLRTPLTRMKLALEFLGEDMNVAELKSDVGEMERMVNIYLDFARGEGTEIPVETDIVLLLEDIAAAMRREGRPLSPVAAEGSPAPTELAASDPASAEFVLPVRPNALRRCLGNLIANASRHGSRVWLSSVPSADGIDIIVDDDGPGIPPAERERVFRPFVRLDTARSPATGSVGLGLTIARDVARSHGGDVRLETSPQGGLRARVHLPR